MVLSEQLWKFLLLSSYSTPTAPAGCCCISSPGNVTVMVQLLLPVNRALPPDVAAVLVAVSFDDASMVLPNRAAEFCAPEHMPGVSPRLPQAHARSYSQSWAAGTADVFWTRAGLMQWEASCLSDHVLNTSESTHRGLETNSSKGGTVPSKTKMHEELTEIPACT